jgi:hypothetical protein
VMNSACDCCCSIRFRQKSAAFRQIALCNFCMAGSRNDFDRWPPAFHKMGELEPVHRTRHVDVGKDQANVASLLKDRNGLVSTSGFDHVKTVRFDHRGRVHADQCLVFHNKHDRSFARSGLHEVQPYWLGGPTTGAAIAQIVGYPTLLQRANRAGNDWFQEVQMKSVQRTEQLLVAALNSAIAIASHSMKAVRVQNGNSASADLDKPGILE